jgi:hypothetical protein
VGIIYPQITPISADFFFKGNTYPQITQISADFRNYKQIVCVQEILNQNLLEDLLSAWKPSNS